MTELVQPDPAKFRAVDLEHIASVVDSVYQRVQPLIVETPLQESPLLSLETGGSVRLKMDHMQLTGSFKLRGASAILQFLSSEERDRGVVTASTGNHGLGTALASSRLGVTSHIYLPHDASKSKVDAIRRLGAETHFITTDDCVECELAAIAAAKEKGLTYISPYNDPRVIAGQATIGVEILAQCAAMKMSKPDVVLVSVGGGGLIAGVATYLKHHIPGVKIIGCQPRASRVMAESVKAGRIVELPELPTLSDGTAGGIEEDTITFPICQKLVDDYIICDEDEIAPAMRWIAENERMIVEGSAALCVASLLKTKDQYKDKTVDIVLCGRNITMAKFMTVMRAGDFGEIKPTW